MTATIPTLYGISLDNTAIFGMRRLPGISFSQRRELIDAATAWLAATAEPQAATETDLAPLTKPACGGYCDTDNNGVCYTCGGYSPARDAGRII